MPNISGPESQSPDMRQYDFDNAWTPVNYRVFLCDIHGKIIEELTEVSFEADMSVNEIATANVSVSGRKVGYFKPWLHTIAIIGTSFERVVFFGPIVTTRTQVVSQPEYRSETELDCQGWEAWLDRLYPQVDFFSDGAVSLPTKTAWDAVYAVYHACLDRAKRFQVVPTSIRPPAGSTRHQIPISVEWDTLADSDQRIGAPTGWGLISDIHAQGVDVSWRPTWSGDAFYSRCVIGGSANESAADNARPHTGRWLKREYVVGSDVGQMSIEYRGDMQATAVLVSGVDGDYGVAPWRGLQPNPLVDWDAPTAEYTWWAGLLLESQVDLEVKMTTYDPDNPESVLRLFAERQRRALRKCPVFISEVQVRFKPGDIWPGDCIIISDNQGAQILTDDSLVSTRWAAYGRVSGISISSSDALFANLTMYQFDNEPSELLMLSVPGLSNPDFYDLQNSTWGMTSRLALRRK